MNEKELKMLNKVDKLIIGLILVSLFVCILVTSTLL